MRELPAKKRRRLYEERTADANWLESGVWGVAMYGRWDGPDLAWPEEAEWGGGRRSLWDRLGIEELLHHN